MNSNIEKKGKKPIKISVIIPVYNAEKYLDRCINSLFQQTLKDIEIILVNDGSTDRSAELCEEYKKRNPCIHVSHLNNGGPARARNKGMELAEGEYIGFVDADDYVEPDMFEKLYYAGQKYNSDIVMCGYLIDNGTEIRRLKFKYEEDYLGNEIIRYKLLRRFYTGENQGLNSLCNKIFRKKFINDNQLKLDESLFRAEDFWFVFESLKWAEKFVFVNSDLYYYRQNETSIMHTVDLGQYERWVENKKRALKENDELKFEIDKQKFYGDFLYKLAVYCRALVSMHESEKVKEILLDDFYRAHAKYTKTLPKHVKLMHFLGMYFPELAILLYKIWAKSEKGV